MLYTEALSGHARAVNDAHLARGNKQEYERVRALTDEARRSLNAARSALEQHKHEHGC